MPTIQEFKERLNQIREAIEAKLPDIAAAMTVSAKALAERNIKDTGFGKAYSLKRIPAFLLLGKDLNASGRAFLKAKIKEDEKNTHIHDGVKYYPEDYGTNWGDFRRAQGLQSYHVDLSYSNMMWSNMQPVKIQQDGTKTVAFLGGTNDQAQNEMNWNRDRYGDFINLGLTEGDRGTLRTVVGNEVRAVLDQFKP